jgi:hypothetical protein
LEFISLDSLYRLIIERVAFYTFIQEVGYGIKKPLEVCSTI